ncbi:hypothetical protein [Alicyclobacillus macrosporangiidus]|uniref:Uncharacterized protein n=1 Tax=Alicyclobacillus macrosporangiidus TaxID=392015 RepID=A0A1I7J950_9BACL|nr:hypothetical protein [Alicyclobacillus macrosporangiidus]SFU81662.1 hypothetical protein SAMN05421543_10915 [Alicyclobacillus macrosporangiidus]
MAKNKKSQYVILDLGKKISADELIWEKQATLALEIIRENSSNPYSRLHVHRVIPCRFERGKLYRT